jgi:hypothetical protein
LAIAYCNPSSSEGIANQNITNAKGGDFLGLNKFGASDFCVGRLKKSRDSVKILRYAG